MNTTTRFDRRGALRAIGGLVGVGLAASAGASALAQQPGGMPGMPGMGGGAGGGMMSPGAQGPGGMMPGMHGMMEQGMQGMMGMMGGLMGPDADRLFIQEMIPHHQGAVAMATVAWQQAEHPEVKQLAEAIVRTQNFEIEQMAAWYRAWFDAPAVSPGRMPMMMAMMGMTEEALKGARPADRAFLEMMTMHHQMAVMMASMALGAYQHPELGALEQAIVAEQAKEIAQMRAWHRAWYPA